MFNLFNFAKFYRYKLFQIKVKSDMENGYCNVMLVEFLCDTNDNNEFRKILETNNFVATRTL